MFKKLAVLGTVVVGVMGMTIAMAAPGPFQDTFSGFPAGSPPVKWDRGSYDVQVHTGTFNETMSDPVTAHHSSADCAGYPATHTVDARSEAVYFCNDHVMTAIGDGYGLVYLTPAQLADFSSGEVVIKFDMSTLRASDRDWVDIWVTPYEDNLARPLDDIFPPLQGEPKNAVHIRMDNSGTGSMFRAFVVRNHEQTEIGGGNANGGYKQWLTPSATRRDTFELRISRNHVKFGMPAYDRWWADSNIPDLGWTSGVVQLGHHSYNPHKGACTDLCGPNTWHWDDVSISNAVPFTIINADRTAVYQNDSNKTMTFDSPAPANAHLRFAAVGTIDVSFDGGPFTRANRAAEERHAPEHPSSYWTPVPQGTRTVTFRLSADSWMGNNLYVQDATFWSKSGSTGGGTVSTPTATRTSTAVPATATPVRTSTVVPPTATPVRTTTTVPPTATAVVPTATPGSGAIVIDFNTAPGENTSLNGQFPAGVINWGSSEWHISAPWGPHSSKSISFNGPAASQSLTLLSPRIVESIVAGGTSSSTITLSCSGNPTITKSIAGGQLTTITTGWTKTCTTVTIGSSNGWDTNFDDLRLR